MYRHLLLPLLLLCFLSGCASDEPAQRGAASSSAAPAASPEATSGACATAQAAAEASWQRHFGRVPGLAAEDRSALAVEHARASPGDLGRLEEAAREGGDEGMLDAIAASRKALAECS